MGAILKCTIHTLKTVHKTECGTMDTSHCRYTGEITDATSQTSQLSVAGNNNHLATCFALRTTMCGCFCQIAVVTNVCWVCNELATLACLQMLVRAMALANTAHFNQLLMLLCLFKGGQQVVIWDNATHVKISALV